jgi:hypothetical protein
MVTFYKDYNIIFTQSILRLFLLEKTNHSHIKMRIGGDPFCNLIAKIVYPSVD